MALQTGSGKTPKKPEVTVKSTDSEKKRKKEAEVTAESLAAKIIGLEEEIASITLRLSELERAMEPIEIESISLLKLWTEENYVTDEVERKKRMDIIRELCDKEKKLESEYVRQCQSMDDKMYRLRLLYLDHINQVNEEKKNPPAKGKAKTAITVSVHQSSLISGSSSGIDDVNYNRIFRKWEFESTEISKPAADVKDPLNRNSVIFQVAEVVVMNREVCLKRIIDHPKLTLKDKSDIIENHKHSKDLLGHPNLLTYIGAVVEPGKESVIVELARNKIRSLLDVLLSQKINAKEENEKNKVIRLGFPRKLSIMKKVASALAWLHEKHKKTAVTLYHYLHLRLKPSNILFTSDWNVKVSDYGLNYPKVFNSEIYTDQVLFDQQYAHYSAPELFEEKPNPNQNSDSWSLGMIYYTLLTDKIPFDDCHSYEEIKNRISEKKLPILPTNTPPKLKEIIQKCWDYDSSSRPSALHIVDSNPWAQIFTEATTEGSDNALAIWDAAIAKSEGGDKKSMPWEKFAPVFWQRLFLDNRKNYVDSDIAICLKDLLRVDPHDGLVMLDYFSDFARTFSPLQVGNNGPAYIQSIVKLCKSGWFYGVKDRQAMDAILNNEQAIKATKSGKIAVVLRISANQSFQFCYGENVGTGLTHSLCGPKKL
jgi:hypothetical protein